MAESVNLPLTGFGDSTAEVAVDTTPDGVIELVKLAISADGSAVLIPANLDGLFVQPRLESPQDEVLVATALTAGTSADLDASPVPVGKVGRLLGADVGGSVPFRFDIQTVTPARVTRTTVYTWPGETIMWRPPFGQKFIEIAGGATNRFGVSVTNLDVATTADGRVTFYWDEITP